jgi:acyl carrier protein|tara:strand:- start:6510 stop:7031 length:522 start_codon:yes stop_codon:yes gene_type:complete
MGLRVFTKEEEVLHIGSVRQRLLNAIINIVGDIEEKDNVFDERLDDLDFIEIIMEVESEFDTKITEGDKRIGDFEKVKDLIDWFDTVLCFVKLIDMKFIEQVENLKVFTVTKPRTYITWTNTEKGRDVIDTYERIDDGFVVYVNQYNKSMRTIKGDSFFDELEEMYNRALNEA